MGVRIASIIYTGFIFYIEDYKVNRSVLNDSTFAIMDKKALQNIRHLSLEELQEYFSSINEKKFRTKQVYEWIWKKRASSFEDMTDLSKDLREKLSKTFTFPSLSADTVQKSTDGTIKTRFKTFDGHAVEGVLIPTENRQTACVSSQIGCSLSCKFCATGYMDRKRNLDFDEIYDQKKYR